ncbi:MAG TPA: hypothetical protein ENN91_04905 [Firmicutes bacterium]|nr:hypothetical protein [Bacillota bacterium]
MNFKNTFIFILTIGLLLVAGCGNEQTTPDSENAIEIKVVNNSEEIIVSFALFYGPDLDEWGEDLLNEEIIGPGDNFVFMMPPGSYDLFLLTYENYVIDIIRDIDGNHTIEIGEEGKLPILFTNSTDVEVGRLFISPSESDSWGSDWLGQEVIPPGVSRFFFIEPGIYDILAQDLSEETLINVFDMTIESEAHLIIE